MFLKHKNDLPWRPLIYAPFKKYFPLRLWIARFGRKEKKSNKHLISPPKCFPNGKDNILVCVAILVLIMMMMAAVRSIINLLTCSMMMKQPPPEYLNPLDIPWHQATRGGGTGEGDTNPPPPNIQPTNSYYPSPLWSPRPLTPLSPIPPLSHLIHLFLPLQKDELWLGQKEK